MRLKYTSFNFEKNGRFVCEAYATVEILNFVTIFIQFLHKIHIKDEFLGVFRDFEPNKFLKRFVVHAALEETGTYVYTKPFIALKNRVV